MITGDYLSRKKSILVPKIRRTAKNGRFLEISGATGNNLKNIKQVFIDCDIEIERLISRMFTLWVKLLNNEDLQSGSILIDLGFETTRLGLFKNLALVHSITFPFGINHIIKDLSKVCSLNLKESEIGLL
mgnify:CR=1 FL=1